MIRSVAPATKKLLYLLAGSAVISSAACQSNPVQTYPPLDPSNVPEDALSLWVIQGIFKFAPWTPGWESAFPTYFNQTLRASFNTTMYDYNGLFAFFGAASESINGRFTDFGTNLTNVVTSVNPSNAKEGVVSLQGLEGGNSRATGEFTAGANSVFAVVNVVGGEQKIVEWRELNLVH